MAENTNINEIADATEKKASHERSPKFIARLIVILTAVCVAVAGLLAAVNAVTKDKIAENEVRAKAKLILDVFEKGTDCELYSTLEDGTEVYLALRNGDMIGYSAFLTVEGYTGGIDMMVGINSEYKTEGVRIVSMSESSDAEAKVNTPSFLDQFKGALHGAPVDEVDAVAGATISSEAVKVGVSMAHSIEMDLEAVASQRGCRVLSPAELESAADGETDAESGEVTSEEPSSSDDNADDPVSADTTTEQDDPAEETSDLPFVDNPGGKDYNYKVDATTVTDKYVIEIPKDEETNTTEKETTPAETTAPETTAEVTVPKETIPVVTRPVVTTSEPETEPETTGAETTEAETTEAQSETTAEEAISA